MDSIPVIALVDVRKIYPLLSGDVHALDGVSLTIEKGEFVAIMGPSGSGKSTLMNQIGCLDVPTSGTVKIEGQDIGELSDYDLTALRRDSIGYIFQKFKPDVRSSRHTRTLSTRWSSRTGRTMNRAGCRPSLIRWASTRHSPPTVRRNSPAGSSSGWQSHGRS